MASYTLTNRAVEDLSGIWSYTFDTWSEDRADRYYHEILECCQSLAEDSALGKLYKEIQEDIKGYRMQHHIIFYRKSKRNQIEVIRILHKRMDLRSRLRD